MKLKKAQGLPVNIVITVIIGIIIFGLGMGLFSSIFSSGEDEVAKMNEKVKTGITSLECDGEDWICSPAYELENGEGNTFTFYISNRGDEAKEFKVRFINLVDDEKIEKTDCGYIKVDYPDISVKVQSGQSAEIPFVAKALNVIKVPSSFVGTVELVDISDDSVIDKTSVIVKII